MPTKWSVAEVSFKPWQKGIPLGRLKAIREVFKAFDKGLCYGAFSAVKENTIADWLSKDRLLLHEVGGSVMAAIAYSEGSRPINGFAGPCPAPLPKALRVKRIACLPGAEPELIGLLDRAGKKAPEAWVETWTESERARRIMDRYGAHWLDTKVMAGSELVGIFYRGKRSLGPTLTEADLAGLCRMKIEIAPRLLKQAVAAIDDLSYADHYSGYNKRHSWTALALRGFSVDPEFIIKPTEMSKKWKNEHPEAIDWCCRDTSLRATLPQMEPLIRLVPGGKERIRLMRLAPGGGELARHADVTDPDAGTDTGQLMRIHIPLVTNPQVTFQQWMLDGSIREKSMASGEVWYLDTRKPHTARNGGGSERVHLVMDVHSSPKILELLV